MDAHAFAYYNSFRQSGDLADLRRAIESARQIIRNTPTTHPSYWGLQNNLGLMLQTRFERLGNMEDLNESVGLGESVLRATSEDHRNYPIYLSTLSNRLQRRFERTNTVQDLTEAIRLAREAVNSSPHGHPYTTGALKDLSVKLARRHEVLGGLADLDEAIELAEQAANAGSGAGTAEAEVWHNLANMYDSRFSVRNKEEDLERAIEYATRAADVTPETHPNYGDILNGLGALLYKRFLVTSNMGYLKEAISKAEKAVNSTPKDHPYLAGCLANLGHMLWKRFERTGRTEDLADALHQAKLAVDKTPSNSFDFPLRSNSLGAIMHTLYDRSDNIEDLDGAIVATRNALQHARHKKAAYLNNLSVLLIRKFEWFRDKQNLNEGRNYLNESIQNAEQAVKETEQTHPSQASHWNNLGIILEKRFQMAGDLEDLNRAIWCGRKSVAATPTNHTDLPGRLNNLGHRLCLLSQERHGDEALACFKNSWDCLNGVPFHRVDAARQAVRLLKHRSQWEEAKVVASRAIDLLPILNNRSLNRQDQQLVASKFSGLVSEACSLSLEVGDSAAEALMLLERGRGSIMGLLMDDQSDTALLQKSHPDDARSYEKLRLEVNAPTPQPIRPTDVAVPTLRNRGDVAAKLNVCISRIRQLPGFERFLLGPSAEEMKELAEEGPIAVINVTDLRSDALIVLPSAIKSFRLHAMTALKVKGWLEKTKDTSNPLTGNRTYVDFLKELWSDCVRPVLQETFPARSERLPRIWWIGIGEAGALPFHIAGTYSGGAADNTANWAISSYISTLKALAYARRHASRMESANGQSQKLLIVAMPETPDYRPLRFVKDEVSAIREATHGKVHCKALSQPNARTVLDQLGDFDIVHFACHGVSDPANPMRSYLVLQETRDSIARIDKVTVRQISEASLRNARIAYLSACSTAENRAHKLADEVIHLASAFQVAGFCHVISSMWTADDQACISIAKEFYRQLASASSASESNRTIADALHNSVAGLRRQAPKGPLRWGPFIHFGA